MKILLQAAMILIFCSSLTKAQSWNNTQSIGGNKNQAVTSSIESVAGNLYVAGTFDTTFNLYGSTIYHVKGQDAFLAKLNSEFKLIWVALFNCRDSIEIVELKLDNQSNIYVAGNYNGDFVINSNSKKQSFSKSYSNYRFDGFVSKFDSSGVHKETFQVNDSSSNKILDCVVSENETVIISGAVNNAANKTNGFLIGTSLNGKTTWKQSLTGTGDKAFSSIVQHKSGDIISTGYFYKNALLDNGNTAINGKNVAMVLVVYSEKGKYLSNFVLDSASITPRKMLIHQDYLAICGEFEGQMFGTKSEDGKDVFVLSYQFDDSLKTFEQFNVIRTLSSSRNIKLVDAEHSINDHEILIIGRSVDTVKAGNQVLHQKEQNSFIAQCPMFYANDWNKIEPIKTNNLNGHLGLCKYKTGNLVFGEYSDSARFDDTVLIGNSRNGFISWYEVHNLTTSNSNTKICLDSNSADSIPILFEKSGIFKKNNKFLFEVSTSSSFDTFHTQVINFRNSGNRVLFHISDSLVSKKYFIRLASTNPRLVSLEATKLYLGRKPYLKPIINGPDTISKGQPVTFSVTNYNKELESVWLPTPDSIINDSTVFYNAINYYATGFNQKIDYEQPLTCWVHSRKELVLAPVNEVNSGQERESRLFMLRCIDDTFTYNFFSKGYFNKDNWFKLMADTTKDFSNPFVLDSFKTQLNIYGETEERVAKWKGLDPGKYYIRIQSTSPYSMDQYFPWKHPMYLTTDKIEASKILGDTAIYIGEEGSYKLDQGQAFWIAINGTIKSTNYANEINVEWNDAENSKLIAIPFSGGCVGDSLSLEIEIINSINEKVQRLNVYPIPADNNLFVEVDETTKLVVCDISGREVLESTTLHIGLNSINVSRLKTGSYILYLMNEKSVTQQKFTIE